MNDVVLAINQYLMSGGLFNPEYMNHDAARDLMIEARAEIERLQDKCNKQAKILRHLTPEKHPDTLFITSIAGKKDKNNMPEKILVVPAYGVDFSYIYEYNGKTTGQVW